MHLKPFKKSKDINIKNNKTFFKFKIFEIPRSFKRPVIDINPELFSKTQFIKKGRFSTKIN